MFPKIAPDPLQVMPDDEKILHFMLSVPDLENFPLHRMKEVPALQHPVPDQLQFFAKIQ
jgi:hypothetical protein